MIKKILIAFSVLILLLAGGGYYLASNLDSILRTAIEKYASEATQTKVSLKSVSIKLKSGEVALSGLSIGSPAGFDADKTFYLGDIKVKLDTASVRGTGPILISDVTIDKPQITYEVNATGQANLQTIVRNANSYASSLAGRSGGLAKPAGEPANTAAPAPTEKPGRKVIIKSLTISDGQVGILQPLLKGKELSASLPTLHLSNIGQNSGGATAAEVAQQLITVITASATQTATATLAKDLAGNAKDLVRGAIGGATGQMEGQLKGLLGR
jgi:hypothetical protein